MKKTKELSPTDKEEYDRVLWNLASLPSFTTTTSRAVAKELLKQEWLFCRGDIYDLREAVCLA